MLVTVSNAATADEYNVPSTLFGTETRHRWYPHGSSTHSSEDPALNAVGGCEFGPPTGTQPCQVFNGSGFLTSADGKPSPVHFAAFGLREDDRAESDVDDMEGTAVLAAFDDGVPALTQRPLGKGSHLHYGWLPGISYAYQRAIGVEGGLGALLKNISALAGACAPVEVSARRVEAPLMIHPSRSSAVVTLLNWRCTEDACAAKDTAVDHLSVQVRLPFATSQIRSATRGDVVAKPCVSNPSAGGCDSEHGLHAVCFNLELGYGDFVTFHA